MSVNPGTGTALSRFDVLNAMSKACGPELTCTTAVPRTRVNAELYEDPKFAKEILGRKTVLGVDEM